MSKLLCKMYKKSKNSTILTLYLKKIYAILLSDRQRPFSLRRKIPLGTYALMVRNRRIYLQLLGGTVYGKQVGVSV